MEQLVEFESRVIGVWRRHDDAVICTYHLAKFGADTVIDILRTHPMIIIGGILQHNPFFIPPNSSCRSCASVGPCDPLPDVEQPAPLAADAEIAAALYQRSGERADVAGDVGGRVAREDRHAVGGDAERDARSRPPFTRASAHRTVRRRPFCVTVPSLNVSSTYASGSMLGRMTLRNVGTAAERRSMALS